MNCDNCNKILKKRKVEHVNVENNPQKHTFCSRKCFLEFIEQVQANGGSVDD